MVPVGSLLMYAAVYGAMDENVYEFVYGCQGAPNLFCRRQEDADESRVRLCNLDAQTLQWNTWFGGRTSGQIDRRFVECLTKLGYVETGLAKD